MGKGERVETYVTLKSPINTALLSGALRRQLHYPEYPLEQALTYCQVVDKDAVAEDINQILMKLNEVYRLGGISRRTRASKIQQYEQEILDLPPRQQPLAIKQLQRSMRITGK